MAVFVVVVFRWVGVVVLVQAGMGEGRVKRWRHECGMAVLG